MPSRGRRLPGRGVTGRGGAPPFTLSWRITRFHDAYAGFGSYESFISPYCCWKFGEALSASRRSNQR
jgi:hypothetical protein